MINTFDISRTITTVLKELGVYNPARARLIMTTFLMESNISRLMDDGNASHGFMMMTDAKISKVVKNVSHKPALRNAFWDVCGIDVNECDKLIINDTNTNIKLMIALTYAFYDNAVGDVNDDSLEEVARLYLSYYHNNQTALTSTDVVSRYNKTFID